jgi:hypothetical protein
MLTRFFNPARTVPGGNLYAHHRQSGGIMATKDQYEFFKTLYQEQNDRKKTIETRAQLYLTVQTLYFGFVVLKFSDLLSSSNKTPSSLPSVYLWLQILVAALMATALVFTLLAVKIRQYEAVCDLKEAAISIDEDPEEGRFFDLRIGDFVVASNRNIKANSDAADSLKIAGRLMVGAIISHLAFLVVSLGSEVNLGAQIASVFETEGQFPVIPAMLDIVVVFVVPPFLWWRERRTTKEIK